MRWVVLRRAPVSIIVGLLVVAVLAYIGLNSYSQKRDLDGENLLSQGLTATRESASFRYKINARLVNEQDGERYLSRVTGAHVAPDRVQIKGALINTPIEIVHIGDTAYIKDQVTGRWMKLKGNHLGRSELFVTEINPLGMFNFRNIPLLDYKGRDRHNGKQMDLIQFEPTVANPYLETQYVGFIYKVWLSPQDQRIHKATLEAQSKTDETEKLLIEVEIWDYDKKITIDPPI